MKIRNGFVSNSSSASFIIKMDTEPLLKLALEAIGKKQKTITVFEVACQMLKASGRRGTLGKLRKEKKDYDCIEFPSINEDTCIYYDEDHTKILINTCNNELVAWRQAMEEIRFGPGVEEIIEQYDETIPKFIDNKSKKKIKFDQWERPDEN